MPQTKPMENQVLIQNLEVLVLDQAFPVLSRDELKKLLDYVKNLERCMADAIRLAHERTSNVLAT